MSVAKCTYKNGCQETQVNGSVLCERHLAARREVERRSRLSQRNYDRRALAKARAL